MRSLRTLIALVFLFVPTASLIHAQGQPSGDSSQIPTGTGMGATKEEVDELRSEVAAQRKTIEELKALLQRLVDASPQATNVNPVRDGSDPSSGTPHLVNATYVEPEIFAISSQAAAASQTATPKKETPLAAGWNGEHFFIRSSDGQFQLLPYGYFQSDYRAYLSGDGAPANTFLIRRARFGFQGNYGNHYDFALLIDGATSGPVLRDLYVNARPVPEFQVQIGQYKEPFAQEELTAVTNIDFVERSLASLLYPSASTAFRSPGITLHGDLKGGVIQWWAGAFNGKGILVNNTTSEPEFIGRLRFYPWRKKKDSLFQGLAFGGAFAHGRTRALSNEQSFSACLPDAAYCFFPSFIVNGATERYNAEGTWVHGRWGVRAEYDQLNQDRDGVGSFQANALGFTNLPTIRSKAGYAQATYLLTGETRPENGTPRVKRPFLGPEGAGGARGYGAFELAFRYSRIQAIEPGLAQPGSLTPGFVPTFDQHTDQFTIGLNWYLNYWVKYQANVSIDRLSSPSTLGQVPQNFAVLLQRLQFRF